jgi:hypothetical protein
MAQQLDHMISGSEEVEHVKTLVFQLFWKLRQVAALGSLDAQLQDRVISWTKYKFNVSIYAGSYAVHRQRQTSYV